MKPLRVFPKAFAENAVSLVKKASSLAGHIPALLRIIEVFESFGEIILSPSF